MFFTLYLFLLITAAITFFLFGEQLLHPQVPPVQPPPLIRIPNSARNYTQHQYTIQSTEPSHNIEGIVFGTVLKSAENAKTTIFGLADRLMEGLKVRDSSDNFKLAVFDVFGAFEDLDMDRVEDEKRIKILIYPMKKSYDPCLILTKDEVRSRNFSKI